MKDCFVMMPIGSGDKYEIYFNRYDKIIKPAIEGVKIGGKQQFRSIRADFISESGSITRSVVEYIYRSDAVVADLTDLNPNVFYELGVRHALRKGTVLVALADTEIPFDLGDLKVVFYKDRVGGELDAIPEIATFLEKIVENTPQDSPIFNSLPELSDDQQVEARELKAKLDAARNEVAELRAKLAITEEVSLNFRKAFSSFEDLIRERFSQEGPQADKLSDSTIREALKAKQQIAVSPHFNISGAEVVPSTCFVLAPFGREFDDIYQIIRSWLAEIEVRAFRADEIANPGVITDQIFEQIARSEYILADITGQNPNVMLEVGIAQTLGKKLIIILQDDNKIPFDLSAKRIILYRKEISEMDKFRRDLLSVFDYLKNRND